MAPKRRVMKKIIAVCLMLVIGLAYSVQPSFAESDKWGETRHIGKYYFKVNNHNDRLYISKHKNKGFKKTPVKLPVTTPTYVSNGKQVLYMQEVTSGYTILATYLKSYDISSRKVKKIGKLPNKAWTVVTAHGRCIWLEGSGSLYSYNPATDQLKLKKKNIRIERLSNSYLLITSPTSKKFKDVSYDIHFTDGTTRPETESISSRKASIYHLTRSGKLKRVKSLGTTYYCFADGGYLGEKPATIYYVTSRAHKIYRIKWNGKSKKRLASVKGYICQIDTDYYDVIMNGRKYSYKYGSKKGEEVIFENLYTNYYY